MPTLDGLLYKKQDVYDAVLAGENGPDADLARGAAMIAERSGFRLLVGNREPRKERIIHGVSALSIAKSGVITHRPVIFHESDPDVVNYFASIGTTQITEAAAGVDKAPTVRGLIDWQTQRTSLYDLLADGDDATIGGVVLHSGDEPEKFMATGFTSDKAGMIAERMTSNRAFRAAAAVSRLAIPRARKGHEIYKAQGITQAEGLIKDIYVFMAAAATLRSDVPVVVDRQFMATL